MMGSNVIGLIGVDTIVYPLYSELTNDQINEFVQPFEIDFSKRVKDVVSGGLPDDVDRDLYDQIAQVMLSAQIPVVLPSLRALLAWDFRGSVKRAQVGLTCICSMDNIAELDLNAFDDLFAIRSIADVGHFLMMENPAAFNRELEFLIDELNEQKR